MLTKPFLQHFCHFQSASVPQIATCNFILNEVFVLQSQKNNNKQAKQLRTVENCGAQNNANMVCYESEGVATQWVGLGP